MPPRLTETYRPGDPVEVLLADPSGDNWRAARVVGLQHPGVWVQTEDGLPWFVTNTRRIRARPAASSPETTE